MTLVKKISTGATIALLACSSLSTTAFASEPVQGANDLTTCSTQSTEHKTSMALLSGEKADKYTAIAKSKIDSGEIISNASVALGEAKVYEVNTDGKIGHSITFKIDGEYSYLSNFTVLLGSNDEVLDYSETQIGLGEDNNFKIVKYQNGNFVSSEETTVSYMTDEELRSENYRTRAAVETQGVGSTVACVASVLGVSGAVGYLIVGACSGACAASATGVGAGICIACIGAYATVGGASITAVASCFKQAVMEKEILLPVMIFLAGVLGGVAIFLIPSVLRGEGNLWILSASLIASISLAVFSKKIRAH